MAAKKRSRIIGTQLPGMASSVNPVRLSSKYGFLHMEHPIFTANKDRWLENERLMYGGDLALEYLRPFEWEVPKKDNIDSAFKWRKQQAVYPNLPDKLGTVISNHLARYSPRPDQGLDFGELGKVGSEGQRLSQAELVYYSCDHPGQSGTHWDAWWQEVCKRTLATGHRWIFVNAPPTVPQNREDERRGKKPYLQEFSPLEVPNWYFNASGDLEFVVITVNDLNPHVENETNFTVGSFENQTGKMLLVRKGVTRLGAEFQAGGWWMFDNEDAVGETGTFNDTEGEIPFFPYFAERSKGVTDLPSMSRPATTELGNCAIAIMNLTSAANFNAWDGAKGLEWLLGVDLEGWKLAMDKMDEGSRWLPLPPNSETDDIPSVAQSGSGKISADVFKSREESLWMQAQWLGIQETMGAGSTAAGSNADFSASQMPRILQIAMQTMSAQNMAIYYLELRFGHKKPRGQAIWPTKFNLVELSARIKEFFEAERLSGLRATSLDSEAMLQLAVEKGLIASETEKTKFRKEYITFGETRDEIMAQGGKEPGASQDPNTTAPDQAARLADNKKTDGSKGTSGRPAPT